MSGLWPGWLRSKPAKKSTGEETFRREFLRELGLQGLRGLGSESVVARHHDHIVLAVQTFAQGGAELSLLVALAVLLHTAGVLAGAASLLPRGLVERLLVLIALGRLVRVVVLAVLALAEVGADRVARKALAVVLQTPGLFAVARLVRRRRRRPGDGGQLQGKTRCSHYRI